MRLPEGFASEWLFEGGAQVLVMRHQPTGLEVRGKLPVGRRSQEDATLWTHALLEELRAKVRSVPCASA